ncbi:MAG TPA: hypothetical protein VEK07_16025 [Polyangiaceae bacterium]|nr:hypothetical protein [Polyangiaceae bacterium]
MHDATSFAAVFAVLDVPCSHVEVQLFGKPPQAPEFSNVHCRMAAHPAVDVQVASALVQSLHLLSLQEHKSKEEELLLPPDPALEPELLDEPPVPELDELDELPVLELDDAPVPDPDAELLLPPVVVPAELLLPAAPPAVLPEPLPP